MTKALQMAGMPTRSGPEVEHRSGGVSDRILLPPRPCVVRMEEVCRLQIGWADGTIVGLEEQRWPTAALVEVQERPPERILSIIDHGHPGGC